MNKMLVAELARAEFIDRRENVLFVGNPGTGKSHLAIAPSAAACAKGYRVRFFRVTELVTLLIADLFDRPPLSFSTGVHTPPTQTGLARKRSSLPHPRELGKPVGSVLPDQKYGASDGGSGAGAKRRRQTWAHRHSWHTTR